MHRPIIHWILRVPLNINGQEAKLNDIIWKPKYNDYRLTKYINQNLNEAMSKDYAEAMPGVVKGADGKIILKPHHLFHLHFNWRECKDSMGTISSIRISNAYR